MLCKPSHVPALSSGSIAMPEHLDDHAVLSLMIAGVCLLLALRYMKKALQPVGALVQAAAAAALVAFSIGAAFVLLTAAALSGHLR
jgi:hypothetical protein